MLAIISGRDTQFLAPAFPTDRIVLVGNHGLEEQSDGKSRLVLEAAPYAETLERVAESADALVDGIPSGASVERKRATVAVHVRRSTDPTAAANALRPRLADLAAANGLELREGRLVFELRPPISVDKGEVIDRLLARSGAGAVLFAGDDTTDVDAFSALKRWRGRRLQTVAVAVRSSEAPPELLRDADLVVEGVPGIVELLSALSVGRP